MRRSQQCGKQTYWQNYGDHPRTPVNVDVSTPLPTASGFGLAVPFDPVMVNFIATALGNMGALATRSLSQ